jgi:protein O-GlcNAc transferase
MADATRTMSLPQAQALAGEHARAGRTGEAEKLCRAILVASPDHVPALHLLALLMKNTGREAEARATLAQARALAPEQPQLAADLAVMELGAAQPQAPATSRAALALPRLEGAQAMRIARAAEEKKQPELAEEAWRTAIARGAEAAPAWSGLARVLERTDRLDEAREACERAIAAGAGDGIRFRQATMLPSVYDSGEHVVSARRGFAAGLERLRSQGLSLPDPAASITRIAFNLAYQGYNDRDLMVELAALFRDASPTLGFQAAHVGAPRGSGRLKLGFVSRFLYEQTVGSLMEGLIAGIDRQRFEVHVFAPPRPGDPTWERIAAAAEHIHALPGRLAEAQRMLAGPGLDALVFAGVGMDSFLYFLAHGRYARVQAVTWGHPVTTGLPSQDLYLSARDAETADADSHYSETLVRLAQPSIRYERPAGDPARTSRTAFNLPEGATLYGCLQTVFKYHPDFDAVLRAVLEGDPKGRLVLLTDTADPLYERLRNRLARSLGPAARRTVMVPHMARPAFQSLLGQIDVLLDPLHFGGGQTTLEAIAVGTPVVTLPAAYRRGRLSLAYLTQAGVTDTVASDIDDYVARALALGRDPNARAALGERLRRGSGAVFDNDAAVRELESVLLDA